MLPIPGYHIGCRPVPNYIASSREKRRSACDFELYKISVPWEGERGWIGALRGK